jgi:hypothetical protein
MVSSYTGARCRREASRSMRLRITSIYASQWNLRSPGDGPKQEYARCLRLSQLAMCPAEKQQAGQTRLIIQPSV